MNNPKDNAAYGPEDFRNLACFLSGFFQRLADLPEGGGPGEIIGNMTVVCQGLAQEQPLLLPTGLGGVGRFAGTTQPDYASISDVFRMLADRQLLAATPQSERQAAMLYSMSALALPTVPPFRLVQDYPARQLQFSLTNAVRVTSDKTALALVRNSLANLELQLANRQLAERHQGQPVTCSGAGLYKGEDVFTDMLAPARQLIGRLGAPTGPLH